MNWGVKMKEKSKYGSIFDNNHTPMLIIDSETGEIRDGNLAACNYYGYIWDKLPRLNISDINILNQQQIHEEMEKAQSEDRKYFRFKHKLSNGEIKDVEVYSGPITVNGESLLFSIIHDVEDKREMERRIRLQESYFESLYENSPEGIAMLDNDYRIININESFERIFQYGIDEIRHRSITEVICEEKFYDESTYFKDSINRGEFVRKETIRRRKDGTIVDISFLGYPIILNGEQLGVYGIYSDLSKIKEEKKEQEKRIQMYIRILRNTIDSIPDIISVFRPDFTVEFINEAGCKYFHVSMEKNEGMNWNDIIRSKFYDDDHYASKSIETKSTYSIESWFSDRDQYFDWRCDPIFDADGELILIVERIRDITEKRKYEEQLKEAKLRAEETSRFKTQFIANMTHEIRTPVNGIVGIIELLEDTQLSEEQKEYFQLLKYSTNRLSSIINDVLDISKIEAGKLELRNVRFNIKKLLNSVARYYKIQAGRKGLDLNYTIQSDIPDFLLGDPDKLNQILFNLLSNAVKFTETGHIDIDVMMVTKDVNNASIRFSISDTGIGIPKEKAGKIFEDFYQLETVKNRKYGGTGLGLSISRKLVKLMGSDIIVRSEFEKGSTLYFEIKFRIPALQDNSTANGENDEKLSPRVHPALNILVVEDEIVNQKILKSLLEKNKCNVTVAENGEEALKILEKRLFDVIFMDIYMPEMNGYEAAKLIRKREALTGRNTPIIAITAAVQEDREKYLEAGIDDCIAKPAGSDQIYSVIARVLKNKNNSSMVCLKSLIDRFEGDHELLNDIIDEVVSSEYEKEFFGGLEAYIRDKDFEKLNRHIHKFKGSISHFQADSINKALSDMKECCKNHDLSQIEKQLEKLKLEYTRLRECLMIYQTYRK